MQRPLIQNDIIRKAVTMTNTNPSLPIISMGDPAGIGPELCCQLAATLGPEQVQVAGNPAQLEQVALQLGLAVPATIVPIAEVAVQPLAQVNATAGKQAWQAIDRAVDVVLAGQASALVTAPVHKQSLQLAGCPYPGHRTAWGTGGGAHCALWCCRGRLWRSADGHVDARPGAERGPGYLPSISAQCARQPQHGSHCGSRTVVCRGAAARFGTITAPGYAGLESACGRRRLVWR